MKKSTMTAIANYIENVPELATEYAELRAELDKNAAKAEGNRKLYAAAHDIIMAHLSATEPLTVAQVAEMCADELPENFSKSKIQFAFSNYWKDEITKHENGKNPYTYTKRNG